MSLFIKLEFEEGTLPTSASESDELENWIDRLFSDADENRYPKCLNGSVPMILSVEGDE